MQALRALSAVSPDFTAPALQSALGAPQKLVTVIMPSRDGRQLDVSFDDEALRTLLLAAGGRVWITEGSPRLVVAVSEHGASVSDPKRVQTLLDAIAGLGVTPMLEVGDIHDRLPEASAFPWRPSLRYQADYRITVNLEQVTIEDYAAAVNSAISSAPLYAKGRGWQAAMGDVNAQVAVRLRDVMSVDQSQLATIQVVIPLEHTGLRYGEVMRIISSLDALTSVHPVAVSRGEIVLSGTLTGPLARLVQGMRENQRLSIVHPPAGRAEYGETLRMTVAIDAPIGFETP